MTTPPAPVPAAPARPGRTARRGEEGSISVLAAASFVLALSLLAAAVDLGSIVLADRDLQGAVDIAALDAVAALGDLAAGDPAGDAEALAVASLARNAGWAARDATGSTLEVQVGRYDVDTRTFTPTAVAPDAVAVTATSTKDRFLNFIPGSDTVRHTAVARNVGEAAISIGTSVASFDSDDAAALNAVLPAQLGSPGIALDAVGYQGLANGQLHLQQLSTELGLASPTELLDTRVTARGLFDAAVSGLTAQGDPLSLDAATPLGVIAAQTAPSAEFDLGDLFSGQLGGPTAFGDVALNVLDLVVMTAQLVNGDNVLDLVLPVSVPGVAGVTARVGLIEPVQSAFGRGGTDPVTGDWRTVARSSQVRVVVEVETVAQSLPGGVQLGAATIPFTLDLGRGEAPLGDVVCASTGPHPTVPSPVSTAGAVVTVGVPPAASEMLPAVGSAIGGLAGPLLPETASLATVSVSTPLLGLLDLGSLTAVGQHTVAPAGETLGFVGPYAEQQRTGGASSVGGTPRVPSSFGDGRVGLAYAVDSSTLGVSASGALGTSLDLVADVLDPAMDALTQQLDAVDRDVVGPLVRSLGATVGAADVAVADIDCGVRVLAQ